CCRTSKRLGGEDVKVIVRSGFEEMKASPWEKEDAQHEGIPILNYLVPKKFVVENGKLTGMVFEKVKAVHENGRRNLVPTGEPDQHFDCDDVLVAVGQENAFPWVERDCGIEFEKGMPKVNTKTMQSSVPNIFFGVATAWKEAQRCLNCDVQTVFTDRLCIECDACVDICPMDCITFTGNADEKELRNHLNAPAKNLTQDLYVSGPLKTGRVMVKD